DPEAGVLHGSTGVAHSQQASPRQDITPVILLSQVPLRPEPYSEPGGGPRKPEHLSAMCGGRFEASTRFRWRFWMLRRILNSNLLLRDVSRPVSFAGEAVAKLIMGVPRRFRWVTFLVSKEALRHSRVWGKPFLLSFHLIGFRHSLQGMWAASSVNGLSSTSSTGAQAASNHDPLVDAHQRLIGEVFFLRSQVNDMMACRDLLVQLVRASSKWDLMRERLEKLVEHWILKKSIADIYSCPGGSTSSRGVFPGSPPRILLWGRDSRRSLLSE
ncbi:hypothetical protein HID58_067031, partial [Brassica napus]